MTSLLDRPVAPALSATELVALVTRLAAEPGAWKHLLRFDDQRRQWVKLPSPDNVDVWVLMWLPDQATELHDHGDSTAAYTVLSGAVEEVRPVPGAHGVRDLRTSRLTAGQTRWLPPGAIHDVRGAADGPAVSLHAYSPPLARMTWYDDDLVPVRTEDTTDPE